MKEYEISINDKVLGKTKIYKENIKEDIKNTLIESKNGLAYKKINNKDLQTYEITYTISDIDELFDIVSKYIYDNELIFENIEKIKEYNNIKTIKKDTKVNIVIPEIYLNKLNISKTNIDYNSLLNSKVHFIKNTINKLNNNDLINSINEIIVEYNNFKKSNEYEFLTEEEKEQKINNFIKRVDIIISYIENNTDYKYGLDYIIPIKISNN